MKQISSGSGLGDILQDKVSDRWDVERTLDSLKTTIESVYQQVEEMIHFPKASAYQWQLEQEFKAKIEAEIEAVVMSNCIWTVRLENMRGCFCDVKNVNWDGKMKEISDIRDELNAISKSLTVSDNGQLSSQESLDGEEGKKGAGSHRKVSASSLPSTVITAAATLSPSASSASSLWEENGIHDEIEINMEEHLDPALLEHMISHCKNEITKLKRNHESKIQDLTEQHFSHRRELLRERGPCLTLKMKNGFGMLRKRISEVVSKVDEILVEKEEVDTFLPHAFGSNEESLSSLKDKVETLLSENHQLRDLLEDNKRELKTVGNLKADMEDAQIEALIGQDIFANIVREVVDEIKCIAEESQVENSVVHDAEPSTKCELEDLNMESVIMQELCDIVFKDALKDAEEKFNELNIKYIDEYELRVLHEMEKQDKEKQLKVEVANKESLRQEVLIMVKEKEQLAQDAAAALAKEKERYEISAQEVENLRGEKCQHQKLISESLEVSKAAKHVLDEALKQNDRHKADISKLEQKLEVAREDRRMLLDDNQEKQVAVSLLEEKNRELSEQFESIAVYVSGLLESFNDFECRVTQEISGKCTRLKSLTSQSHVLQKKADVLVRRGLLYKQGFEKKCADLEKAEAEVDLLGDKVETMLNLVEKLYIGLDHYSPILQHYPGITEILKLLKRELSPKN